MFVDRVSYLLLWHLEALQTFKSYELSQIKFRTFPNKILCLRSTRRDLRIVVVLKRAVQGRAEVVCWGVGRVCCPWGWSHRRTPGDGLCTCKPAGTAHLISGICEPVVKHSHH